MRLITNFELGKKSDNELAALFRMVSEKMVVTMAGTPERRNALASLENISHTRAARLGR